MEVGASNQKPMGLVMYCLRPAWREARRDVGRIAERGHRVGVVGGFCAAPLIELTTEWQTGPLAGCASPQSVDRASLYFEIAQPPFHEGCQG